MSLNKTYVTRVSLGIDPNSDTIITGITGSSTQLTATSFLAGQKGEKGDPGVDGVPGPNTVNTGTSTTLTGILKGNGSHIALATSGTDYLLPTGSGTGLSGVLLSANAGVANGSATLDSTGHIPQAQFPAGFDDIKEYANLAAFPGTGIAGVVYLAIDTGYFYRWTGSAYVQVGGSAPVQATPTLSGIVKQTVYNIVDYGAVGDAYIYGSDETYYSGATDNTAAINAAIAAIQATTTQLGVLYTPPGAFMTDMITLPQGVTLRGAGRGLSGWVMKPTAAAPTLLISAGFSTNVGQQYGSYAGPHYFDITDMFFDGNVGNIVNSSGSSDYRAQNALIKLYGWHFSIRNVEGRNAKENGLYTEYVDQWSTSFNDYQFGESIVENLFIKNYGSAGWCNRGPHDTILKEVYLSGYNDAGATGVIPYVGYIQQSKSGTGNYYSSSGTVALGLHVWGEHTTNAVYLDGSNIIEGWMYAEGSYQANIKLVNSNGNKFRAEVGYAGLTGTAPAIELFGASSYNYIEAKVESNITGALFQLDTTASFNYLAHTGGYNRSVGAIFDLSTGGTYAGIRNTFVQNQAYNGTIFAGTPSIQDFVKSSNDILNPKNFGAIINGRRLFGAVASTASTTVTVSGAAFVSGDAGKKAIVYNDLGAGTLTTIQSVTNSTTLVLAANAGITTTSGTGYIVYGTDDSGAIQACLNLAGLMVNNVNANDPNQPTGSGHVTVRIEGTHPQSLALIASQLTIPSGVTLDSSVTLANVLPSRNTYCVAVSPYAIIRRLEIENLFGTGMTCGTISQQAHIVIGDLRVWHSGGTSTGPVGLSGSTSTTGGTLSANTRYYVVTAIDSTGGETIVSNEVSVTSTGTTSSNSFTWTAFTGAVSYRIYRGTVSGAQNLYYTSGTNSFTDTGAANTSDYPVAPGVGLRLYGYHYEINALFIKIATLGIYHRAGSDCAVNYAYVVGCVTGIRCNGTNQLNYTNLKLDTCGGSGSLGGIVLDNGVSNSYFNAHAFQVSGTSGTLTPVLNIGPFSTIKNTDIRAWLMANNTGGTGTKIANAQDVIVDQLLSNDTFSSGINSPITTAVSYGGSLAAEIQIRSVMSASVTNVSTGTQVGTHEYQQGETRHFSTAPVFDAGASMNSQKITSVLDPTNAQDAATKSYVDAVATGLSPKASVQEATAAALPTNTYLSGVITITATGVLTVDGQTVALNDRVLVKDETASANNGIYLCTTAGSLGVAAVLTRASDSNAPAEIVGAFVFVETGTVNAGSGFVNTNSGTVTIGTTAITYTQFSGAGEITAGTGLVKSGNTISIGDAELLALAGLSSASDKIPYFTGSGTAGLLSRDTDGMLAANSDTVIATQKAVKTYADTKAIDAAVMHLTGNETIDGNKTFHDSVVLYDTGTMATTTITPGQISSPAGLEVLATVDMASNIIRNVGAPSNPTDVATAGYVDTWAGSTTVVTLGTIATGVWNGTIVTSAYGGTGNGFTKFSGPTTSEKTFTLPDASSTIVVQGGALGTPSSATLTNATGLPVSGITPSTSSSFGAGTVELGHASDTTLSRSAAGQLAVEGVDVLTTSNTKTLTNKDVSSGTNTFPTFNQNTSGTAAGLSGTPALPNGTTATTQSINDNSTKLATTAYVDRGSFLPAQLSWKEDFTEGSSISLTTSSVLTFEGNWHGLQIVGGTQSVVAQAGTFANPGQILLTTSATSGQGMTIWRSGPGTGVASLGALGSNAGWELHYILSLSQTTTCCIRFGLTIAGQNAADGPTSGIYYEYDTANTGNTDSKFTAVTRSASTSTFGTTNQIAADTSLHHFRIRSTSAGTIGFTVDGGTEYTTSSNVPTAALGPFIQLISRTSATKSATLDFVSYISSTGRA